MSGMIGLLTSETQSVVTDGAMFDNMILFFFSVHTEGRSQNGIFLLTDTFAPSVLSSSLELLSKSSLSSSYKLGYKNRFGIGSD